MQNLSDEFNKSAADDPWSILQRRAEKLPDEKLEIYNDIKDLQLAQDAENISAGHTVLLAEKATSLAARDLRPSPDGTLSPFGLPVMPNEVEAFYAYAESQNLPVDQVTPRTPTELYIVQALPWVEQIEANKAQALDEKSLEHMQYVVESLEQLDIPEFEHSYEPDRNRRFEPGDLTHTFNHLP